MAKSRKHVIITDVDNTVFDWLGMWASGFDFMLRQLVELSRLDENTLKRSIKRANQKFGTTEYSEVALHLDIFDSPMPGGTIEALQRITEQFHAAKEQATRLYPGVESTMSSLRARGFKIVCLTESIRTYAEARVARLGLSELADLLVCSSDNTVADFVPALGRTSWKPLPVMTLEPGLRKPSPYVLDSIARHLKVPTSGIVYVGDSLFKDVTMANAAGIEVCWAKYGDTTASPKYLTLREVSHWSDQDINAEINLASNQSMPDHVLERSFDELLAIVERSGD